MSKQTLSLPVKVDALAIDQCKCAFKAALKRGTKLAPPLTLYSRGKTFHFELAIPLGLCSEFSMFRSVWHSHSVPEQCEANMLGLTEEAAGRLNTCHGLEHLGASNFPPVRPYMLYLCLRFALKLLAV